MQHPALVAIALLKQASESINTAGAGAAYGNATKSLMSGTTGKSTGKRRHPSSYDPNNPIDPDVLAEAAEAGHPASKSIAQKDQDLLADMRGKAAALILS